MCHGYKDKVVISDKNKNLQIYEFYYSSSSVDMVFCSDHICFMWVFRYNKFRYIKN